jgi:serine/threonine protein phosphatase PrpC
MLARYGAIAGAIRRGADTELLPFPAQPAGMETGCEPLTYSCEMDDDCWLVLVSDGIADRPGQLGDLLDGCSFVDGEVLARAVVDAAVRRDGGRAKGDMTAVVATSRRAEAGAPVTRRGYVSVVASSVPQWRRA